jgi:hypothetical protein
VLQQYRSVQWYEAQGSTLPESAVEWIRLEHHFYCMYQLCEVPIIAVSQGRFFMKRTASFFLRLHAFGTLIEQGMGKYVV